MSAPVMATTSGHLCKRLALANPRRQQRVAISSMAMLASWSMARTRRTQGILGGRSEQVVNRVLDASVAELARSGYAAFRMESVADEAKVNKTSIYRRWP